MPSATSQRASADATSNKAVQLVYLCAVQSAVNDSCKELKQISYTSGNPDNDHHLNSFQKFLCKLAQVCDTAKGGDTITALVALKTANGPGYLFASNNRKELELKGTMKFLTELLEYVGKNPLGLGEKAMSKQILWRALEFGFPKVEYYIKRVAALIEECIELSRQLDGHSQSVVLQQLKHVHDRAKFSHDMLAGENARNKFLRDCEILIRAIHALRESSFMTAMYERTHDSNTDISRSWCELRHYLGRLHSYRQAAECIYKASRDWPEMFKGFTVNFISSSRPLKLSLPKPHPGSGQVIQVAFPDINMDEYHDHLDVLRLYSLDENLLNELPQKSMKLVMHCEVLLHSFLVRSGSVDADEYWNDSMFIATSKPPCRLCHYYFSDIDNDFQVQSSHMNVYPKWRLPDLCEGQDSDAAKLREELLDEIIEKMQHDTLSIVKEKVPQGKRNDSRTDSRTMESVLSHSGRVHEFGYNSGRFSTASMGYGRSNDNGDCWENIEQR
ncbi:conserved hypothetical protein [Verticillium alfalfae VaMs.102]|uniref:Uncharacterized protein n=1 Tax=Verticillium alfalfae (strain VaMs.102 / ATCC MYA-4576 / FGSC 10136) TaxID=526221 RepID=C9SLK7_VERA1|nr:conserved hypothetical protein [Verticillium alfalfae VaMs.102]EEY19575.1 conserved hypothetical protein [Verticillium alfalfae VaMs.102]